MPLIAHNNLPTYERLKQEGQVVLPRDFARRQDIREIHIGLLNMMPDAALEATERQFYRLIGGSNQIAQFYIHPFTLDSIQRSEKAQNHINHYYEHFNEIKSAGLDALIISGANVTHANLEQEVFWQQLIEVVDWATDSVTSTLTSCLATHAVMQFRYQQKRQPLGYKRWGVYQHQVINSHPLVNEVNNQFDVPHSRYNEISEAQFKQAGLKILVASEQAGVHLATSEDGFKIIFFQGHPEYDAISLLKEYKREVFLARQDPQRPYPPFPEYYLNQQAKAILNEYAYRQLAPDFPEKLITKRLKNTWHDTAEAIVGNWIGLVYQITHPQRHIPYMEGVDILNPLNL